MTFYNSINDGNNFVISFTKHPQQDFGIFAIGYTRSASVLAEHLFEKPYFSDYEAYPVVFLYRHAFELYLKGLYYKAGLISFFKNNHRVDYTFVNTHRLKLLADTFKKICIVLFPTYKELMQFANKLVTYAIEFEQIDRDSFGYRYPIDNNGNHSTKLHQVVNLRALYNAMQDLLVKIEVIDFGFDIEASKAQKLYTIIQETQAIIVSESD